MGKLAWAKRGISLFLSRIEKKEARGVRERKTTLLRGESSSEIFFSFSCFRPPEKRNRKNLEIISTKTDITEKECDFDQTEKKCHNRKCHKMSENSDNVPYIGSHKVLNKKRLREFNLGEKT